MIYKSLNSNMCRNGKMVRNPNGKGRMQKAMYIYGMKRELKKLHGVQRIVYG